MQDNFEDVIAKLGYDPHEPTECICIASGDEPHRFGLADHRNISKRFVVKAGDRFTVERGLTVARRKDAPQRKGLCSILEMVTGGSCVPVDSDKGRAFLRSNGNGKKAAA